MVDMRCDSLTTSALIATLYAKRAGYGALALAARIAQIERFPGPRNLAKCKSQTREGKR